MDDCAVATLASSGCGVGDDSSGTGQLDSTAGVRLYLVEMARRVPALRGHSVRVAGAAAQIGALLNIWAGQTLVDLPTLQVAGLLHDVGKLALPAALLAKAAPPTSLEWALLRLHPEVGAFLLAPWPGLAPIQSLVRTHHERWDGRGYPQGLAGSAIPLGARILAVADAWDSMRTPRPYQAARPAAVALAELNRESGRQFDPVVVQGALGVFRIQTRVGARWPTRLPTYGGGSGG